MNCLKCGRELEGNDVFCPECLEDMERHPVRINTAVHIPQQPAKKFGAHRRAGMSAEEQVKRLRRTNQQLKLVLILVIAVAIFFALLAFDVVERSHVNDLWGQNYSIVDDSQTNAAD